MHLNFTLLCSFVVMTQSGRVFVVHNCQFGPFQHLNLNVQLWSLRWNWATLIKCDPNEYCHSSAETNVLCSELENYL